MLEISGNDARQLAGKTGSTETMTRVIIDLAPWAGREIRVRVVDEQAGGAWGHVNFDDFKFYATRPIHAGAVEVK